MTIDSPALANTPVEDMVPSLAMEKRGPGVIQFQWVEISITASIKMKQLGIDVSPPANIINFKLGLTHMTFDPDP